MNARQSASPSDDRWTIGRLLEWTTGYFQQHGVENPRLDVEILLSKTLQCERIELYSQYDAEVDEAHRASFKKLVVQRAEGCPVAYLVGSREFYSLDFKVTRATLVPRPETEHVVAEALKFGRHGEAIRFLDIGTGTGAIAVTLLHLCPAWSAVAVDVSPEALEVAKENARAHGAADRLDLRLSDVYENVADETFDMIISNPPYVAAEAYDDLEAGVREHEPRLALDGGPQGLTVYRKVFAGAAERLRPGGRLILEIGAEQDEILRREIAGEALLSPIETVRDLAGLQRVLVIKRIDG